MGKQASRFALPLLLFVVCAISLQQAAAAAGQDPWQVLGVRRSATRGEITRAFRRLSRQWHPDKNPSKEATEKFQEISAAYDLLTDPTRAKTLWEAPEKAEPGSAFTATFGTVQYVLDLDPNRLRELLSTWTTDWASKNWETFGPLWHGPVDQGVCWCMENAWWLPRLTEPVSKLVSNLLGTKHREGAWRAWRLSGALLEFSAWSSRQSPCLRHHLSSTTRTEQDALAQLKQQLHVRRKARQAALEEERRRRKRSRGQDSSSDDDADAAAGYTFEQRLGSYSERSWEGGAQLWGFVLVVVAAWLLACEEHRLLLVAPVAAAGAVMYCISSGVLLPNEAAVQKLARIFDQDGLTPILLGIAFVLFSLVVGLLVPLLLAAAAFIVVTWLWAATSTLALSSTPAMSQAGLALWMAAQVYLVTGGGDLMRSAAAVLGVGWMLMKAPKVLKWWFGLLTAPLVLGLAFLVEVLRGWGLWRAAPAAAPAAAAAAAAQQAAAAAAAQRAAEPAAPSSPKRPQEEPPAHPAQDHHHHHHQQQQQPNGVHDAPEQQNGAAAGAVGSPGHRAAASGRSRSSSRRKGGKPGQLLPDGPWWPRSFGPVDLAATCYWWTSLLGWHLASWALRVAAISCQLTVVSVLFAVVSAAWGAPIRVLTLQLAVRLLLLRGGVAAGLLWKLWPIVWQQLQ